MKARRGDKKDKKDTTRRKGQPEKSEKENRGETKAQGTAHKGEDDHRPWPLAYKGRKADRRWTKPVEEARRTVQADHRGLTDRSGYTHVYVARHPEDPSVGS